MMLRPRKPEGSWIAEILHIELTDERFLNLIAGVVMAQTEDEDVVDIDSDEEMTIGAVIDTQI
jgi:hypothetical protein